MKSDYNILKEMKRLRSIRGYGTELISVYVPSGFQLNEEINRLRQEYSESSNIKSKQTRGNVLSAIDKIIGYLRLFKETPKNGIAVFCGNVSDNQSKIEIELFSIEPPSPINVNIYRCDSTFLLEPLEVLLDNKNTYCLLAMDGREATIGILKGAHIQVLRKLNSTAHAKVRKGGQSAQRYQRAIEESIGDYVKRISESINEIFVNNQFKINGVIVGGPGPAKEGFIKGHTLNYQIKIIGTYDTGYTDEFGLHELVEKAQDLLKEEEAAKERKVIEHFMQERVRNGLATFGYENTKKALSNNQVKILILSDELELHRVTYKCNTCGQTLEKIEIGNHKEEKHSCGGFLEITNKIDVLEELIEQAESLGVEVVFVTSESSYGKEFTMGYSGLGAILRYK
ncbi:MAG: peptide chain release factor aRF-1 [Candidatus Micrarchaeaceae archaeon]